MTNFKLISGAAGALFCSALMNAACASDQPNSTHDAVRGGETLQEQSQAGPNDSDTIHAKDVDGASVSSTSSSSSTMRESSDEAPNADTQVGRGRVAPSSTSATTSAAPATAPASGPAAAPPSTAPAPGANAAPPATEETETKTTTTTTKKTTKHHGKRRHHKHNKGAANETAPARSREAASSSGTSSGVESDIVTPEPAASEPDREPEPVATAKLDARKLEPSNFYEPQSSQPQQIGSTEITGKDKSLAALERNGTPFVDAAAKVRASQSREATEPLSKVDFNKYSHRDRARFASDMTSRLENIDQELASVRLRAKSASGISPADASRELAQLEADHQHAESAISGAGNVGSKQWDKFKGDFRSQISSLESSLQSLNASIR